MEKIGVEPTGMPFNSKLALELLPARSVNPLVNAGAIAQVSMVKAGSEKERWAKVLKNLSDFAGSDLKLMNEVYTSEYESSWSNRAIATSSTITSVFTAIPKKPCAFIPSSVP